MKKSFMTRALATGLSLAMAFSLTAATNVTSASAAAKKPKLVTYAGASAKSLDVKVGETVKVKVNAATKKNYKISAVKVSGGKSAKIAAKKNKAGTVVAITGKTATPEGKQASVKVSFKAKKTGKTSKYSYVSKVTVAEDKLTMTAEATGAKKLAVKFNKTVDTTAAKLTVKTGSAAPTITATTFAADAKSAEIVMGTKLTAGTYTVEFTLGEDKLTADVTVQDEKMTAFELVSKNLVADPDSTTKGSISYKAVNQYGEMMAPGNVEPTCSFGTVDKAASTTPTADKAGKVVVNNINTALAIVGTTGTIVLVDTTNGVNLNETITYQSKAVPSAATIQGIYSDKTDKLVDGNLKAKTKVTDYYVMMNVQDQYGSDMTVSDIKGSKCDLSFNPASVLTNLTVAQKKIDSATTSTDIKDITYDGKSCILVKLAVSDAAGTTVSTNGEISKAGTLTLTIVSANKGVVASPSFTVEDSVTIASLSVSPADSVYNNTDNKLVVEAIDTNGNAVTKYDDLKNAVGWQTAGVSLKKNADGTGTFYYKPSLSLTATKDNKYKDSTITTLIFTANDNTSGKYIVKTTNVTVYAKPQAWKVAGTTADTVTAVAKGEALVFDLSTLNYEDQYGNTINYDKVKDLGNVANIKYYLKDSDSVFGTATLSGKKLTIAAPATAKKGTATLYLQYASKTRTDESQILSSTNYEKFYDIKVDLSVADTSSVTATDLTLDVNKGKTVCGIDKVTLTPATSKASQAATNGAVSVVVTGRVGGKTVVIPTSAWTIISDATLGGYGKIDKTTNTVEETETKTVTVVVDSEEGPQTLTADVVVSNADPKATEIKKSDANGNTVSKSAISAVTSAELKSTIDIFDQYGINMNNDIADGKVVYNVTITGNNQANLKVEKNGTQNAKIVAADGVTLTAGTEYTASVKYSYSGVAFTQDITIKF